MFKKATLALAVCGLMSASAAHAGKVYDQDGKSLDIYARIAMGIEGGGVEGGTDNSESFRDFGSRLRITAAQEVTSDLSAFARVEWRFDGAERDQDSGFSEVRNSYLGLKSKQFGTFMAGNYNSFYNDYIVKPFDTYVQLNYELGGGGTQARGDSLGYVSPDLNGLQFVLSAKHYSERGLTDAEIDAQGGSDVAAQGGVVYQAGPARLAIGFVDDVEVGGGNDEMRYAATAAFDVTDDFVLRAGYETRDDNDVYGGGYDKAAVGATYVVGSWAFLADYYNVDEEGASSDRDAWNLGTMYKLTGDFDMFLEMSDHDQDAVSDVNEDVYYAFGARYHF